MPRERIHQKLLVSYFVVVVAGGGATAAALHLEGAHPGALWRGFAIGAAFAVVVALGLSQVAARTIGATLEAATRQVRFLALARFDLPALPREDNLPDEIDDLVQALGEARKSLAESTAHLTGESQKLRTVLDGMAEGVALLAGGRIRFANRAFVQLLDLPGEVEGRSPLEAVRRAEIGDAIATVASGAEAARRDLPLPSGRVLQLRAAPLPDGAAVVVLLDVTEARSLERMRREFVANASHELRTPVAAIQAVAETLVSAPFMSLTDRERFERILLAHAGRLSRLVNDLLDLSRAESASRPLPVPVDLAGPIASALGVVRERADARRQQLVEILAPDLPRVAADTTSVEQVRVNLLDNAVKYTPEAGRIQLRVGVDGSQVRIEVEDSGVGIAPEHLPRIFERFYRVDPARSRDQGGTGLGLAIVKHLVQSYGGEVSVSSTVGVGTIFKVTLPVA